MDCRDGSVQMWKKFDKQINKQYLLGPQCTFPNEIANGYDGDRRRGYKKLANGIL